MKYFAYGSNMDVEQMAGRCPDARLMGQASLPDHGFRINEYGVATVVMRKNSMVYGVLWRISGEDEKQLDLYEGVSNGCYRKQNAKVYLESGAVQALIYIAANSREGLPRCGYLEMVIEAAQYHRLPSDYVASIRAIGGLSTGDNLN